MLCFPRKVIANLKAPESFFGVNLFAAGADVPSATVMAVMAMAAAVAAGVSGVYALAAGARRRNVQSPPLLG